MPDEPITVGIQTEAGIETVTLRGERSEWDRDGTLRVFDQTGDEVGEFPDAAFAAKTEQLE